MESTKIQTENVNEKQKEILLDEEKVEHLLREAKYEQNLSAAFLWGSIAAVLGAIIWGLVTAALKVQIGWMAVGVGFLVGFSIRTFGKGFDEIFGYIGAGLSLVGCLLGNLYAIVILVSLEYGVSIWSLLVELELTAIFEIMKETFHPMDLFFYGLAIYEGYKFSIRRLTDSEIESIVEAETIQEE